DDIQTLEHIDVETEVIFLRFLPGEIIVSKAQQVGTDHASVIHVVIETGSRPRQIRRKILRSRIAKGIAQPKHIQPIFFLQPRLIMYIPSRTERPERSYA